jgi:XRE family transcriptional regulator, regulator of sulfur utilization
MASAKQTQMGRRLKALREDRGMSRSELADAAHITREYVRRLEAGLQDPTVGALRRIARALRVPVTELVK